MSDISVQPILDAIDEVLADIRNVDVENDPRRQAEKERAIMTLEGFRDALRGCFGDEFQARHFFHFFIDE